MDVAPRSRQLVLNELKAIRGRFQKFSDDCPRQVCNVETDRSVDGKLLGERGPAHPSDSAAHWETYGRRAGELLIQAGAIEANGGETPLSAFKRFASGEQVASTVVKVPANHGAIKFSHFVYVGNLETPPEQRVPPDGIVHEVETCGLASFASMTTALDLAIGWLEANTTATNQQHDADFDAAILRLNAQRRTVFTELYKRGSLTTEQISNLRGPGMRTSDADRVWIGNFIEALEAPPKLGFRILKEANGIRIEKKK